MATATKPKPKDKAGRENVRVKPGKMPEPFAPETCQRMRNIRNRRKAAKVKLDDLISNRESLEEEIGQCSDGEAEKLKTLKSEHFDVEQEIKLRRAQIKWLADEMEKTIEQADEGRLFADDTDPEPPEDLFEHAASEAVDQAGKAAAGKGEIVEEPPREMDQHLRVSVKELDIRENLKGLLIRANFTLIGEVARAIDDGIDLGSALEVGENAISQIKRAVKEFRAKHRKAIAEKDKEEAEQADE